MFPYTIAYNPTSFEMQGAVEKPPLELNNDLAYS